MKDSIKALRELEKRLYAYQYAMAVADYDSETVAPPESSASAMALSSLPSTPRNSQVSE